MHIYHVTHTEEEIEAQNEQQLYHALMSELWTKELTEKEQLKSCMDKEW